VERILEAARQARLTATSLRRDAKAAVERSKRLREVREQPRSSHAGHLRSLPGGAAEEMRESAE